MRIIIGSDHGGYGVKNELLEGLAGEGRVITDAGCHTPDRCDYPVYALAVARAVAGGEADFGIVVCTTGIGVSIAANKVPGVRAALCRDVNDARMCRAHNDANVLALGAVSCGEGQALELAETFLSSEFEGGRHSGRIAMIACYEAGSGK